MQAILDTIDPEDISTIDKVDEEQGRNALLCAALRGHADVTEILLEHGADLTLRDGPEASGRTALQLCHEQWAISGKNQHESTLSVLIDHDPTASAQDNTMLANAAMRQ